MNKITKVTLITISLLLAFIIGYRVGVYKTNQELHKIIEQMMNTDLQEELPTE